jgi:tetratricopeptide (TPR) repeat protein
MKLLVVLAALLIPGCAAVAPSTAPSTAPAPETAPPVSRTETPAVAGLLDAARADVTAGRLPNAAASLERALRIEPRNPRLWAELARVRFKQGDFVQAESTARRSNSWAGSDNALLAENWRLIAQAREARGDGEGARSALEQAQRQR